MTRVILIRARYVHYELPSEVIDKLEHLHFVKDEVELQEKYDEAADWVHKIMSEIDKKEMENLI